MGKTKTGLRWSLRSATAGIHDALDQKVSTLDLTTVSGLQTFLAGNALAHAALCEFDDVFDGLMLHRLTRLREDLSAMDLEFPNRALRVKRPLDTSAPGWRYVMAGSAMGGRLLARRHSEATDPRVQAAGRFLTDTSLDQYWRKVQDELASLPQTPTTQWAVTDGAKACFHLFDAAFSAVMPQPAEVPALG